MTHCPLCSLWTTSPGMVSLRLAMWLFLLLRCGWGRGAGVLVAAGVCVVVLLGCLWAYAVSPEVEDVESAAE